MDDIERLLGKCKNTFHILLPITSTVFYLVQVESNDLLMLVSSDYVPIGPRFSNLVLQALLVLLKKPPPKVIDSLFSTLCGVASPQVTERGQQIMWMSQCKVFWEEINTENWR